MNHQANVLLVDAHAEGVRRTNMLDVSSDELLLDAPLFRGIHACMERLGRQAGVLQPFRHILHAAPGGAIDHRGAILRIGQTLHQQLFDTVPLVS